MGALEERFEDMRRDLAKVAGTPDGIAHKRLYYAGLGATCSAIQSITSSGSELPKTSGMFGAAIPFVDTPVTCQHYAHEGHLLLCDVLLGRQREMQSGNEDLCLSSLRNALSLSPTGQDYEHDSVCGLTGEQKGSLGYPEHM